jgi:hypothetical protein
MSAVLHMPAIDTTLFMLKDKLEESIAPAFTAVNGRLSPHPPHILVTPDCMKGWRSVLREPGSHPVSYTIENECSHGPNEYDGNPTNETRACDERIGMKRKYAHRTRTGCITCRRRKKKWDEAKPKCNNCIRGNFECSGYPGKTPWSKINAANAPPQLQSQERMSSAKIPAHSVRCAVCNILHIPQCEPSQKSYVGPRASSGIQISQYSPASADKQGRKPL